MFRLADKVKTWGRYIRDMTNQRTITIAATIFVVVLATISTQSTAFAVHATAKHVSLHDKILMHVWSSLCSQLGFLFHGNSHCKG